MYNEYRFVDRWLVRAHVEAAYDVIGDTVGPPRPGRHMRIVSRGFLPYLLRWEAEIVEADAPRQFAFVMKGDFVGSGSWTFDAGDAGTFTVFGFRPRVEKPGVKQLSPILKPLFRWNHRWAMQRGERGVNALFPRGEAAT